MTLETTKIDCYAIVGLPIGLRTSKIDVYGMVGIPAPPPPSPYRIVARITIQKNLGGT